MKDFVIRWIGRHIEVEWQDAVGMQPMSIIVSIKFFGRTISRKRGHPDLQTAPGGWVWEEL